MKHVGRNEDVEPDGDTVTPHDDELLDVVDHADRVIGTALRSELYRHGLTCFRVVNAFIRNSRGELWIPRRAASKRLFPLCLDASMGGHVASGETYEEALCRELREELAIALDDANWRMLGSMMPHVHGTSAFMRVFEIESELAPAFNTKDFCEAFWFSPGDLLRRIEQGEPHKGDLPIMVRHFYCKSSIGG